MSNFEMLLENENLLPIAEEVFKESCRELIQSLDEESVGKIEEYVELLNDKKTKKSLENEISEALSPILERNTILYGSFLYETQPIQEEATPEKPILLTIREQSNAQHIANVFTEQQESAKGSKLKTAGKIGAGLGAAGAVGLGAQKLMAGDDVDGDDMSDKAAAISDRGKPEGGMSDTVRDKAKAIGSRGKEMFRPKDAVR